LKLCFKFGLYKILFYLAFGLDMVHCIYFYKASYLQLLKHRSLVLCVCFVERCLLFTGVRVTRSLVLCVCFVERCLLFTGVRVTRSLVLCV
jgi:hypothetical protein